MAEKQVKRKRQGGGKGGGKKRKVVEEVVEEELSPFGTKVVNVKVAFLRKRGFENFKEWQKEENHVYIGRDMSFYVPGTQTSKWRNPYPVKKHGLEKSLELFEKHLLSSPSLISSIGELRGKELGCWCAPSPCHGNILRKLADKEGEEESNNKKAIEEEKEHHEKKETEKKEEKGKKT